VPKAKEGRGTGLRGLVSLVILLGCFPGLPAAPAKGQPQAEKPARVLILHSYDPAYNWSAEVTLGLRSELESLTREVELWVEYLNTRRLGRGAAWKWMDRTLGERHSGRKFDLVAACDDAAVEYLLDADPPALRGVPVVFCGVGNRSLIDRLPRERFTGVEEISAAGDFLDEVLKMFPHTRRLVLITDNSPTGFEHRRYYGELQRARPELEFEFLEGDRMSVGQILERLRGLDPGRLVIHTHFTRDKEGRYVSPRWMAAEVARASAAPVASPHVRLLGQGILAGNASAGFAHGQIAGRMAAEVLGGVRPADIPLRRHGNIKLVVDDTVAQRWGVPFSLLPREAEIVNPAAGWRRLSAADRTLLGAGVVLVVLQMLLIGVLIVNVWQRRKAERELKASREMLDRAQRIARIGLWTRNPATGEMFWSEENFRTFGLHPDSFRPTFEKFLSFVHPADRERVKQIVQTSDRERRSRVLEFRVMRPDGAVRHVRSLGEWTSGPRGEPLVAGTVQDVTEMKQLEELVEHMQRVESLGTLAGGVAHDFNNLLTVINGYSQMLAAALPPDDPRRAQVREIQRAGERASELTRQLLAFSRKQILSPRLIDLNETIREHTGLLKPVLGEKVVLRLELPDSLSPIHADPAQLGQVLINLAANARDAMPAGGTLTIRTANRTMSEFSRAGAEGVAPGRYVEMLVSDTGCGMDEETRRRAFEPFFTTKPVGQGTGLGLATVYGIVRQSGGYITVESRKGAGATFRILFPAAEGAIAGAAAEPVRFDKGSERVLVVDDEPQLGEMIRLALRQAGYEVRLATNAAEALAVVESDLSAWAPDLLLAELDLPGLDGQSLFCKLQSLSPGLKVLFLSHPEKAEKLAPNARGAGFLAKPFTPADLTAAVRSVLSG